MKHLKLYEEFTTGDNNQDDFISNDNYLIENDWEKLVPKEMKVTKNGKSALYEVGDMIKNLNSINLNYNLVESDSETMSDNLNVSISFNLNNDKNHPMDDNIFQCLLEVTLGTLYILGIKFTENDKREFIPGKAELDESSKDCLIKLLNYISGSTTS